MFILGEIFIGIVLLIVGLVLNYFNTHFPRPVSTLLKIVGILIAVAGVIVIIAGILGIALISGSG